MLRAGPITTKEISEAVGLNANLARVRIHEAGGVRDEAGLWRLSERG
jgi:hypothetical protein